MLLIELVVVFKSDRVLCDVNSAIDARGVKQSAIHLPANNRRRNKPHKALCARFLFEQLVISVPCKAYRCRRRARSAYSGTIASTCWTICLFWGCRPSVREGWIGWCDVRCGRSGCFYHSCDKGLCSFEGLRPYEKFCFLQRQQLLFECGHLSFAAHSHHAVLAVRHFASSFSNGWHRITEMEQPE